MQDADSLTVKAGGTHIDHCIVRD